MTELSTHSQNARGGILYRIVQALTGVLLLACLFSGYLGLRAVVWRHESELPAQLASGMTIAGIVGGLFAVLYILFGWRALRLVLSFDWLSVELGLVVGMLLYGGYNMITPLVFTYADEPMLIRGLQGAVDGALVGGFVGFVVGIINGRHVLLTFGGIARFSALFLVVLTGLSILIFIGTQPGIPVNLPFWLVIPLIIGLRLAVGLADRLLRPPLQAD